jgi:hypothetical protein
MVFYGDLLLVTPAFSGLVRGRLPIEISTRGAKFAEEVDQSAAENEATFKELELRVRSLAAALQTTTVEIERLKKTEVTERDSK